MRLEAKALGTPTDSDRVGNAQLTVASVGDTTITRQVMEPWWKWSTDVKPIVGTDLCRAFHQLFIVLLAESIRGADARVVARGDLLVRPS